MVVGLSLGRVKATSGRATRLCHDCAMASDVHLQIIQGVVSRLSQQSVAVKGWCVTLTAALLGFGTTKASVVIVSISVYVIVAFAALDAYYLSLERAFRAHYRKVVAGESADWSMDIMKPRIGDILLAVGSPAISVLYGASILACGTVLGYLISV